MNKALPLLILAAALAPLTALAQSSVWKATKEGATVYLGGTCHLLRPKDFPLPAEFDQAFAAAARVYFETDIARVASPEMQGVVMQRGMFTDSTTLDQVLTPEAWKTVQAYATTAGWPLAQVRKMRPWLFVIMFTAVELQKAGVNQEGVDFLYFKKLAGTGKKAGELERFEDHINFIVNMGKGQESEMINSASSELRKLPQLIETLISAWKAGDLEQIDRDMSQDFRKEFPAVYQALLVDRNRDWLPKIEAMFQSTETELVLVGVAHLAGADGLIAQLKARGYAIEQVRAPAGSGATN